jgi:hypothetical protein
VRKGGGKEKGERTENVEIKKGERVENKTKPSLSCSTILL